jgi:hypothetical protein
MFTKKNISNKTILYQCPQISLSKGFELLQEDNNKLKDCFISILKTFKKFKYYFIEFPPCSYNSTLPFQFVLINAEDSELKTHIADFSDFQEYHTKKK